MLDYNKEYKKKIKENLKQIFSEFDSKDFVIKVENWAEKFGYSYKKVLDKIKTDEMFRCNFIKDPKKQNIYEKLALNYISNMPNVSNCIKDGKTHILAGKPTDDISEKSKSVDFSWKSVINGKELNCYATHKYTAGAGGHQDNQYNDVIDFINACRNNAGIVQKDVFFFAICDGDYYTKEKKTKLKNLAPKNLKVVTIEELYSFLNSQK